MKEALSWGDPQGSEVGNLCVSRWCWGQGAKAPEACPGGLWEAEQGRLWAWLRRPRRVGRKEVGELG